MIRAEMTSLRNNTIWYAFYSEFAIFRDFEKIQIFFQKDPNFERFEESYHFKRILRQLCYNLVKKSFHVQWREHTCRCSVNAIGKHRVKKTSKMAHLSGRLCFHIHKNMAQNNKHMNRKVNKDLLSNNKKSLWLMGGVERRSSLFHGQPRKNDNLSRSHWNSILSYWTFRKTFNFPISKHGSKWSASTSVQGWKTWSSKVIILQKAFTHSLFLMKLRSSSIIICYFCKQTRPRKKTLKHNAQTHYHRIRPMNEKKAPSAESETSFKKTNLTQKNCQTTTLI